jgi:hypothetical protein
MGVYNTKLFYPLSQITDKKERKKNIDSISLAFSISHLPILLFQNFYSNIPTSNSSATKLSWLSSGVLIAFSYCMSFVNPSLVFLRNPRILSPQILSVGVRNLGSFHMKAKRGFGTKGQLRCGGNGENGV